jgi:hypothetical protein
MAEMKRTSTTSTGRLHSQQAQPPVKSERQAHGQTEWHINPTCTKNRRCDLPDWNNVGRKLGRDINRCCQAKSITWATPSMMWSVVVSAGDGLGVMVCAKPTYNQGGWNV